ncbi:MAG: hypothetical protein GF421_06055 [Candidatus Aminicenantes bacterium]|nr:hypothetical protein [Candidatus Aminicenantes bacterium]
MRTKALWGLIILMLVACSSDQHSPTMRFPYEWLDEPGYGGDIDQQKIPEPSGMCYHPLRKTLFIVSDEGEIVEMETDGTPVFWQNIPGDLEAVTVVPETGLLYIVKEGEDVILEFDADKKHIIRTFPLNRMFEGNPEYIQKQEGYDNGIESIAFVPDDTHPEGGVFYLGNQWDPSCVLEVAVPLNSCQKKVCEARIQRVLPLEMDDPAAMYFDFRTGLLNIVNDADNILVEMDLKGKIIREYAFLGNDQEGIAVDEQGYLYIAQDMGGIIKVKDLRYNSGH